MLAGSEIGEEDDKSDVGSANEAAEENRDVSDSVYELGALP